MSPITPELAQEELAEMIGSSRPMVSKLLSEMAERSMIACQGRRYILVRGSGLDLTPQWLLPTASRPQGEASGLDTGLRLNGSIPSRSMGIHDSPVGRAERAA